MSFRKFVIGFFKNRAPEESERCARIPKMNFKGRFQKLKHYRQTNTQTHIDVTECIASLQSRLTIINHEVRFWKTSITQVRHNMLLKNHEDWRCSA